MMDSNQRSLLSLHAAICKAFKQSARAGWAAVCEDVSLEDVRDELNLLFQALSSLPRSEDTAEDPRFFAFRRARLAVKSASESAVMLEPAFCDPVITQEQHFASYHDASLHLASEMAEVLLEEFARIQQEKRLPIEQMCRTASQIPHENLGTEGVYWLRIMSVYNEYCAGLLSEAAHLHDADRDRERPCLVSLNQAADLIGLSVKRLSNRLCETAGTDNPPPDPTVPKAGSVAALYDWKPLRAWLSKAFPHRAAVIPEDFPSPIHSQN